MFLVEKMNIGWENVHEIAEQLEHVHSDLFFDKMDEMLQHPKLDPHGEPIPDKEGNIIDFLTYLNSKELELGKRLEIVEIEKYDQSMTILREDGCTITLSKMVCDKILVKL